MIWHWICHVLGFDYGLPYGHLGAYNAWSGFLSDVAEVAIIGGLITIVRRHNCEVHGCWRLGRHKTSAGHMSCRHHHPDDHLTHQGLLDAHEASHAPPGTPEGEILRRVDGLAGQVSGLAEAVQVVMAARQDRDGADVPAPPSRKRTPKQA